MVKDLQNTALSFAQARIGVGKYLRQKGGEGLFSNVSCIIRDFIESTISLEMLLQRMIMM